MSINSLDIVLQQMLHGIHHEAMKKGKEFEALFNGYEIMFKNYGDTTEMTKDIYMNALGAYNRYVR